MIGKFILLYAVWIGLTNSFDPQELGVGAIISLGVAWFFGGREKLHLWTILLKYAKFSPTFIKAIVQSNLHVARIVLTPSLPVNPGIVKLKTTLKNDYDKLLLASAITLTPGTITIDLDGEDIYIHLLDLQTTDKETLQKEIIEPFEVH
jgi:multicomponent Na+:H+ antiporter subunit E